MEFPLCLTPEITPLSGFHPQGPLLEGFECLLSGQLFRKKSNSRVGVLAQILRGSRLGLRNEHCALCTSAQLSRQSGHKVVHSAPWWSFRRSKLGRKGPSEAKTGIGSGAECERSAGQATNARALERVHLVCKREQKSWMMKTNPPKEKSRTLHDEREDQAAGRSLSLERIQEALRDSEQRYRAVIDNASDVIIGIDQDNTILYVSPSVEKTFGYSVDEVLGRKIMMLMPEVLRPRHEAGMRRYIESGEKRLSWTALELVGLHKAGQQIPLEISFGDTVKDGRRYFTAVLRDITERKRSEEALRQSESRYRSLVEGAALGIYFTNAEGVILECNPAFCSMLGYPNCSALVGKSMNEVAWKDPAQREALIGRGSSGIQGEEADWVRIDGKDIKVRLTGRPVWFESGETGFETLVEDVTERRLLKEKLRQTEKMDAVGRLAGGIAHDFNNILMVIGSYAELLSNELPTEDNRRPKAEAIMKAASRAESLVKQLLAFSRTQTGEPRVVCLNDIVRETSQNLPRLIGEDIEIVLHLGDDAGKLTIDFTQFEQVILNLATNARDAMPNGGRLEIQTSNADIEEAFLARYPSAKAGSYVKLSISDSGVGMDEATQLKIFEPFYTTKSTGQGTGLGLSSVYGIVTQNGGWVDVHSKIEEGTTFDLFFPRASNAAETQPAQSKPVACASGGNETILVVEDEPELRKVIRDYLKRLGYLVLEASNGAEALTIASGFTGDIDALISDVVMPQLGGEKLVEQLLPTRPDLKVILMSGYTSQEFRLRMKNSGVASLQKPFSLEVLAAMLRDVLQTRAAA